LSLALIVASDKQIPKYARDVILLHVGGVALLTLMINATTTAIVINYLGLSRTSDIKKNILVSISYQIENNAKKNIEALKKKSHFNNVDWEKM
jgi:NhaP-type Na+/H+ or K+/H+ antiporter